MKKSDLAKRLARTESIKPAAAADKIDLVVNELVSALRRGEEARLPGLGIITPGKNWSFQQEEAMKRPFALPAPKREKPNDEC